jgi:LytS/YehU family sensor histidine kinase
LILQPIVENSIKHGIAKSAHGGAVRIWAFRSDGMLTLNVYNDGPKLAADTRTLQISTGISNLQTRLRSLYGNEFNLTMQNKDPSGVEVTVSFPFREN